MPRSRSGMAVVKTAAEKAMQRRRRETSGLLASGVRPAPLPAFMQGGHGATGSLPKAPSVIRACHPHATHSCLHTARAFDGRKLHPPCLPPFTRRSRRRRPHFHCNAACLARVQEVHKSYTAAWLDPEVQQFQFKHTETPGRWERPTVQQIGLNTETGGGRAPMGRPFQKP